MATISNAKLTLKRDSAKKTVHAVVTCNVNFSPLDLCQMRTCPQIPLFKLRCELWGEDGGLFTGDDDHLFTYTNIFNFPDATPSATESRTFDVTVGSELLDEDLGRDEIYGRLRLVNINTRIEITKKTNVVTGSF